METPKEAQSWGRPRRLLLALATPEPGWKAPASGVASGKVDWPPQGSKQEWALDAA